mmetsp:Transcript_6113/g.23768  ORF Transcript_6113/g.23768 Transcript_6113/m.23768 type:complete len:130 (-) Transcript_6113:930-1319(-)
MQSLPASSLKPRKKKAGSTLSSWGAVGEGLSCRMLAQLAMAISSLDRTTSTAASAVHPLRARYGEGRSSALCTESRKISFLPRRSLALPSTAGVTGQEASPARVLSEVPKDPLFYVRKNHLAAHQRILL